MKLYCLLGLGTTYIIYLSGFHYISRKLIKFNEFNFHILQYNNINSLYLSLISSPFIGYIIHKCIKN